MKKGVLSVLFASAILGAASMAFAGAYGEAEQPEELPVPAPAAPAPEPEPEPQVTMRKFAGFFTDAETTRGLRGEIGTVYAAEYHPNSVGNAEATNTYLNLTYGQESWEVGLAVPPYLYAHQNGIGDRNDFGDMRLYGKYLPVRLEKFTFGGGLIVSFPTAGSGLGAEEYGFTPFLTWGTILGKAHVRGSIGYEVYTAGNAPGGDDVYDNVDSNLGVLYPVADNVVLRGELIHNHFVNSHADPLSFIPGVDYTIPCGDSGMEVVLRPTLGIGITEAPDWQIGLGIALNAPGI